MSPLRAILGDPMAAPETRILKAMRLGILCCCLALLAWVGMIGVLRDAIGDAAGAVAGSLVILLMLVVPIYLRAKVRADEAHLEARIAAGELGAEGRGS